MKKKRSTVLVLIAILMVCWLFMGASCSDPVAKAETDYQQKVQQQQTQAVGFPNITNFFEKKTLKNIYELRDQSDLVCYAYTQNMDGKYVYIGECIGFGIPYGTQYTNPETPYWGKQSTEDSNPYAREYTIPQADPNGLYSSGSTDATWLLMVNEKTGNVDIMYSESTVNVYQSKLPARLCESWSLPDNY